MSNLPDIRGAVIAAMQAQDAEAFRVSLLPAYGRVPPHSRLHEIVDLLVQALPMTWHRCHEDIVRALQELRYAPAVDLLVEVAHSKHEYLAYDNSYALARKCTWALADIGTEEARARLRELARCSDETIAGYAQKRLEEWHQELDRKGDR